MESRSEFLLFRSGLIMGLGAGLGIGMGITMVANAIVLPRGIKGLHTSFLALSVPSLICFIIGILLMKKAKRTVA